MRGDGDRFVFEIEVSDVNFEHLQTDLSKLQNLLTNNKIQTNLKFNGSRIKIELE
jgi:hypothetical protein